MPWAAATGAGTADIATVADVDVAVLGRVLIAERMMQESELGAVKACPMCCEPIGQIMRYGRPLNHAKVQHAEIKFFLQCSGALLQADRDFSKASRVAADWTARAGTHRSTLHGSLETV